MALLDGPDAIVSCLACRRGHDLTGWPPGTRKRCGCGAIVAAPVAPARASRGACPRCGMPLAQQVIGAVDLDRCGLCDGLFVSAEALTRLVVATSGDDLRALRAAAAELVGRARPPAEVACPTCGGPMPRRALPGAPVALAVCRGHGAWIEAPAVGAVAEALAAVALGRGAELERRAFGDEIRRGRYEAVLAHARALGERTGGAPSRGPLGLLSGLFGSPRP